MTDTRYPPSVRIPIVPRERRSMEEAQMSADDTVGALYTVEDLARLFQVTRETVFRWNSGGTGPRRVLIGRRVYYRSSDVKEWLNARESK